MDEYTLQQELEALAGNAYNPNLDEGKETSESISDTMTRWQGLFNLSADEAVDTIMAHRNNLTRTRVSNGHWETVRAEKESEGYDREAYEYEIERLKKKAALPEVLPSAEGSTVTYLVEMSGPLGDPEKIKQAAGMEQTPEVVSGRSVEEGRPVWLCCIDGKAKTTLLKWAADAGGSFEPTILVNPKSLR